METNKEVMRHDNIYYIGDDNTGDCCSHGNTYIHRWSCGYINAGRLHRMWSDYLGYHMDC